MSLLYLFRHAETAASGLMVGRSDVPLSPKGEADARSLGERLQSVPFSAAWSSPLERAMRTAALILAPNKGPVRSVRPLDGLLEISLGEWEGLEKTAVMRRYPDLWRQRGEDMANTAPPGGESFADLSLRVLPVFRQLCREAAGHERSLAVAHQAVNRAILAHVRGVPLEKMRDIPQPPCALTVFELRDNGGRPVEIAAPDELRPVANANKEDMK